MTMIEKLARALYMAQEGVPDHPSNQAHVDYWFDEARCAEDGAICAKQEYESMARTCLTALLEPTEGVVEAGECGPYPDGHPSDIEPTARQVFAAMIRAALEEKA